MGLAFPAMGYSLIDDKTYRQINLKPTGFSKDPGVSMLRYTPPSRGQFAPLQKPAGGQHAPQHNLSKNIGGQHPPLWHAHTMRTGTWLIKLVGRRWGQLAPQYPPFGTHRIGNIPPHDFTAVHIDDGKHVHESAEHGDVGNVRLPDL